MEEGSLIGQDFTDNVGLAVRKEIHETLVEIRGDEKNGEKFKSESVIESVVEIIIIDASDYDEDSSKPDQYRLEEIWRSIQPLNILEKVKEILAEELSLLSVAPGNFDDFNLDSMSSLGGEISFHRLSENENSIHRTFEKSIPLYYLASLWVGYVCEHTVNDAARKLLKTENEHLRNVCLVLENAVKVNGWLAPDLKSTMEKFDHFKARLPNLIDEHLRDVPESPFPSTFMERAGSSILPQHKQFVINYEIVSEVERAISRLRDVFGMVKEKVLDEGFDVYEEITAERSAAWTADDESETREHFA
jgi:hypothetical protein